MYTTDKLDSRVDNIMGLSNRVTTNLSGKRIHLTSSDTSNERDSGYFEDYNLINSTAVRVRYPRKFADDVLAKIADILARIYGVEIVASPERADATIHITLGEYRAQVTAANKSGDTTYPHLGGTYNIKCHFDIQTVLRVSYSAACGSKSASGSYDGTVHRSIDSALQSTKLYLVLYAHVNNVVNRTDTIMLGGASIASVVSTTTASSMGSASYEEIIQFLDPGSNSVTSSVSIPSPDFSRERFGFAASNPETRPYHVVYGTAFGDMVHLMYRLSDDVIRCAAGVVP